MDIQTVAGLGNVAQPEGAASSGATMGKEDFLKLLVAQLAHQDPLEPLQNTEFVTQLSQFTGVEQLMNMNTSMEGLQVAQLSMSNGLTAALIGKTVQVRGDTLRHLQQGSREISFELPAAAQRVAVQIRDSQGTLVRTLEVGGRPAGLNTVGWDGRDSIGNLVTPGNYQLAIEAVDGNGADLDASTSFEGSVTGVKFDSGVPLLEIGQASAQLGDVIAVRQ
jgi:flagellar basal-body rod modification protein FlgD